MSKLTLLGAAGLAASLIAMPALAQNNGNNHNGALNDGSSLSNGGSFGGNYGPTSNGYSHANWGTNGSSARNANSVVGNGEYANIGWGGHSALPNFIQNGNGNNGNNVYYNNNNGNWRPSQRNPVLADNGDARASQVIGSGVYNTDNQQVGTVNDILLGRNGVWAVISTNNKKVAVPFNRLEFGNASVNGNDKVVLPNVTQAQLNTLPTIHYNLTNYQAFNNNNNNGNGGWFDNGNGRVIRANNNNGNGNGWFGRNGNNANGGVFNGNNGNNGGGPFSRNGNNANNNGNNGNNG